MIGIVDISNFFTWFITQITSIAGSLFTQLDNITWAGFSLLDFMITITILGIFLGIIVNSARGTGNKISSKVERKEK